MFTYLLVYMREMEGEGRDFCLLGGATQGYLGFGISKAHVDDARVFGQIVFVAMLLK